MPNTMPTDFKPVIIKNLKIYMSEEKENKATYKVRAYDKVIKQIETIDKVESMSDLENINGIGKSIRDKIIEIIDKGYTEKTEKIMKNEDERHNALNQFQQVMEIGPVKAKELYDQHGMTSIAQLLENQHLLNDKQRMGLKYFDVFQKRIPRKEMEKHNAFIIEAAQQIDPNMYVVLAGSYRRGRPDSGDIDVLICHKEGEYNQESYKRFVEYLKEKKYVVDTFAQGEKKCMAACKLPRHKSFRRIDLLYTDKETFPFALLYFTGSQQFNVKMREHCLKQGFSLNEYGLKQTKNNNKVDQEFNGEEDIFDFVGLRYVTPKEREQGKIILA